MDKDIVINLAAKYAAGFAATALSDKLSEDDKRSFDGDYNLDLYEPIAEADSYITFEFENTKLKFGAMLTGDNSGIFAPIPNFVFDRSKKLIETEINGSNSVVVERWNTGQWDITITGILIDTNEHKYPTQKVSGLYRLFKNDSVIKVSGQIFYEKDIESIYLKSVHFDTTVGHVDTVNYRLTAKSIKELDFSLLEDE